ncbi:MAG: tetratricopeptide repeat protein [Deltaproteobacteria bacterium]|nr:MAG: tetratricopeptide repeat protein [Deltaproteobacteria bacterium]
MPGASDPPVNAEVGFLLSRIDGGTSLGDVAKIAGMTPSELAARLLPFIECGIVEITGPGGARRSSSGRSSQVSSPRRAGASSVTTSRSSQVTSPNRALRSSSSSSATSRRTAPTPSESAPTAPWRGASPATSASGGAHSDAGGARSGARSVSVSDVFDQIDEALGASLPRDWPEAPRRTATGRSADSVLTAGEWIAIDYAARNLECVHPYQLLGVPRDVARPALRKAYMNLSRVFHPDRWFRREVGDAAEAIDRIFKAVSQAYHTLDDPDRRARLDLELGETGPPGPASSGDADALRSSASMLVVRAKKAVGEKRYAEAAELLERACGLVPDPALRIRLAALLLRLPDRLDDAERWLADVEVVGTRSATWNRVRGMLYWKRDELDRAEAAFRRALELRPDDRESREALARLLRARN